jgi:hypothetical protein
MNASKDLLSAGGFNSGSSTTGLKDITDLRFDSVVTGLSSVYVGAISGNLINVQIPYATISSSIASFTVSGGSVSVNGVPQVSGQTVNNFTSPLVYTVTAADGTMANYTVLVTPITPIPDTGQTSCYEVDGIPAWQASPSCTTNSVGFTLTPGQDGAFMDIPNPRSFTGPTTNTNYAVDYITKENTSGLTWKTCSENLTGIACSGTVTNTAWSATACDYLRTVNSGAGYAGKTNWRLPTVNELANIANYQNSPSAIDSGYFPGTSPGLYWTSMPSASTPGNSWYIDFASGAVGNMANSV